jgi:outer membrane lipoprotein-sorting protein
MKIIRFAVIILIVLVFPPYPTNAQRGEASAVEAAELLKQVVAAYHSFSTYSDRGTAIVHMTGSDAVYKIEFETLFKRPDKVRFAWTLEYNHTPGHKQTGVIWCNGETAWTSYSFRGNKPERKTNLEAAVASATGTSWGTAPAILDLLVDRFQGMIRLDERAKFKIAGKDLTNGVECMGLVGTESDGDELKVWVGREDHLIRRIHEKRKGWTRNGWKWEGGTHEEMRTDIVVDQEIADSRFSKEGR